MGSSKIKHTAVLLFSFSDKRVSQFKCSAVSFTQVFSLDVMFTVPCVTCLHTFMFHLPDRQCRASLDGTDKKAANFIGA
jgi:hypothetical protein